MVLTAAERRMLLLVIGLLVLGTLDDAWRMRADSRRIAVRRASTAARADSAGGEAPGEAPDEAPGAAAGGAHATSARDAPLDLNHATLAELDALPGVGPVTAGRIIDHRARYGPFRDPRDLRAVRGIGPKLYARLQPLVTVGSPPPAP